VRNIHSKLQLPSVQQHLIPNSDFPQAENVFRTTALNHNNENINLSDLYCKSTVFLSGWYTMCIPDLFTGYCELWYLFQYTCSTTSGIPPSTLHSSRSLGSCSAHNSPACSRHFTTFHFQMYPILCINRDLMNDHTKYSNITRFEAFTTELQKIRFFWDVTLCH